MEFASQYQKETYEKILPWMREIFGEILGSHKEIPAFAISIGSAFVTVNVWPWGEDDSTLTARSYVVTGAELTADLLGFLLHENYKMRFGAFGVDEENDIFFQHTIVGSTVDKEELKASILAVGFTADEYDEQITERWGGLRAVDRK